MGRKRRTQWELKKRTVRLGDVSRGFIPEVTALGHPSGGTVPLHPTFSTGDSALPVVGLVPSSPKWRQGEPTGSPKPSLLLSWT